MGLTSKQRATLVVVVAGAFMTILNQTLVTPALPSIMAEMSVDAATAQWLTSGFTLMNAIMIPITAYLQDRFTVRQLFIFSMGVFAAGTLMAAWGPSFGVLLGGRLVQAMGAGILMPMSMTLLLVMFPIEHRGSAMGIFGLVAACAPAIGPTVSGILVDVANWHVMFYVVAALVAVVMVCAAFLVENVDDSAGNDASLDVPSVVLSTLGFGGMLYGFSSIGSSGSLAATMVTIAAMVVGAACVVAFFVRQTKLERPMLQVKILFNQSFRVATIICMLVQAALLVAPVLVPIYVQNLLGQSAVMSGLVIMPGAIAMAIMNPIAGRIFDKRGARTMSVIGMVLLTSSTLGFSFLNLETSPVLLAALFAVRMFSIALINMPVTTWGMNTLDNSMMSHGTSINNTLRMVAGSLGTAIVVSAYSLVGEVARPSMGELEANMLAFNVSFAICAVMALAGLVLTVIFVKGKPCAASASSAAGIAGSADAPEADVMRAAAPAIGAAKGAPARADGLLAAVGDGVDGAVADGVDGAVEDGASGAAAYGASSARASGKAAGDAACSVVADADVRAVMHEDVYSLREDDTVQDAMRLFVERGISACPIVDGEGHPVGFISDGDILKMLSRRTGVYFDPVALISGSVEDRSSYDERLDQALRLPVRVVGAKNVISVDSRADLGEVCRILSEYHLKKVPVMDGGCICGIINRSDITRHAMESRLRSDL